MSGKDRSWRAFQFGGSWASTESGAGRQRERIVRAVRLTTGLILFAYATTHLFNHAFGIRSIAAMEQASAVLLAPWQSYSGMAVLYGSFLIHGILGLSAFYRRRHLRLPAAEAWQLSLGLLIPLLLIPHAAPIRLAHSIYGTESGYTHVLYEFWVSSPDFALPRQILLLLVLWVHGCIGIRAWLRPKSWYPRAAPALTALATLVPVLALLGLINAGLDLREAVQRGLIDESRFASTPAYAAVDSLVARLILGYLAIIASIVGLRALRDWHAKRFRSVRITYPGGRMIAVPAGFSVLEASRWAGVPHESVCGGKGRCSTCRVRVLDGAETLPVLNAIEQSTLRKIRAAPDVRLACQLRPSADVTVDPLVRSGRGDASAVMRFDAAVGGGKELEIAALAVDLRGSTELATGRLPYDALFLFDRYVQVVTGAIRGHGGHVTSIAGDGVMSVFGIDGAAVAQQALKSALDIWKGLDNLNDELASELARPLKIGIGIHVGKAVVGMVSTGASQSLQFLGDTGNVAAKLEGETKQFDCTLVMSAATIEMLTDSTSNPFERSNVTIAGRARPMDVVLVRHRANLEGFVKELPAK